jgi:clan AA aspartic protease
MTHDGTVNARLEAIVRLKLRGPAGDELEIDAVIDTGYTGSLTLPARVAQALGLSRRAGGRAVLADGSVRRFDTFAAEVWWGDNWVPVVTSNLGDESLLGMSLLAGRGLWVEVVDGGAVEVRALGN